PFAEYLRQASTSLQQVNTSGGGGASYAFVLDAHNQPIATIPLQGRLPTPQGMHAPRAGVPVPGSEPISAQGAFVLQQTDRTLPGYGIPFEFIRYYRSDVNYETPIGFGWSHTYQKRIVEAPLDFNSSACAGRAQVFYISERMDQIPFRFQNTSPDGLTDIYMP